MSRTLLLLPLLAFAPFIAPVATAPGAAEPGAPAPAVPKGFYQVKLNGHTFTLPEGFTIEVAAGSDLVPRPIVAAFDEKGRLYVCDSSGSNEKTAIQVEKKPHRIVRLEDTDGDGKFDKSTVFVPNVMFPEGAMWLDGSLYVGAPPHIWKFTDTNDDGVADKTEVWFDGKTLGSCANDIHGPYLGPDGWVYWCKGAFAEQNHTLPNGKKFTTKASHIFRARPDGTGIEPVMAGGMDNPVGLAFTPSGERILSCTFFQHPRDGKRDGLIHAIYGGVYGKDHDPIRQHVWTSPDYMPVLTHMGPAAPAGMTCYKSDQFGKEFEGNLFCSQFNLRKVSRHVLMPSGSTYTTKDTDFVVSDQQDFHPTDVVEDADGSLLIIDTGGWYKLCCPSSQLVKPDVTGAIFRVRKSGAHKVDDPRGQKIDWKNTKPEQLAELLGDKRPLVQQRAIESITAAGEGGLRAISKANFFPQQIWRNAVWAACRCEGPSARRICLEAVRSDDRETALAGLHAVSLWRDRSALGVLMQMLTSKDPAIRRAMAEALGRIGDPLAVPSILSALEREERLIRQRSIPNPKRKPPIQSAAEFEASDRALDHALTYALIEIGAPNETAEGLKHASPRVRRAALVALDQMMGGKLDSKPVFAELDAKDAALRESAWWVAGRHPGWGDQLAGYFADQLKRADKLPADARDSLTDRLLKFTSSPAVQQATAGALTDAPKDGKLLSLQVMSRSGLKAMPAPWTAGLLKAAPDLADRDLLREALAAFRAVPAPAAEYDRFVAALPRASLWPTGVVPDEFKLALLSGRPPGAKLDDATVGQLAAKLGRDEAAALRSAAADVLGRAALTPAQFIALTKAIHTVGPVDLPKVIDLFGKSKDEAVGLALVAALSDPALRTVVRAEQVKPILDKYPPAARAAADKLYALLSEARKDETAKLERLLRELPTGDIRRGQAVFNGSKAQCVSCHKIGYVGGLVGPDLRKIGSIRTERDLLESIVFPSASFVRSYEPVRVTTLDGRVLNGILKKDAPDEIILTVAADKEERVPRGDVESITPGTVSVMPAGLDQQLSPQDLADLVAFLKACQ